MQTLRQHSDDDDSDREDHNEKGEHSQQKSDNTSDTKPLRNPLPPLPERPTAGKRRQQSGGSKSSAATGKDDSNDAKASSQKRTSEKQEERESGQLMACIVSRPGLQCSIVHQKSRLYSARCHNRSFCTQRHPRVMYFNLWLQTYPLMVLVQASRTVGQMVSSPHVITAAKRRDGCRLFVTC